jgi:hypothetical protein
MVIIHAKKMYDHGVTSETRTSESQLGTGWTILPSSVVGLDRGKTVVPSFSSRRVSSQTAFHVRAKGRTQNEKERTSHHDTVLEYSSERPRVCLM